MKYLEDNCDVSQIDVSIKNVFRWEWMERTDLNDDYIREWCKKINCAGQAFCVWCTSKLKYGNEGFKALNHHASTKTHVKQSKSIKGTVTLSRYCNATSDEILSSDRPLDIKTRKIRGESLIASVIAENSLPFTLTPKLIELAQNLGRDQSALQSLSMNRTTLSYKLKYGLAKTITEKIVTNLQTNFFSLSIDESKSNADDSILAILVQFYSDEAEKVVTQHLKSLKLESCTSHSIYSAVVGVIEENKIPWENLVSILMDSCNTMRGNKAGVETKIRKNKSSHLLNIDGETCHTVNNCAKKFISTFDSDLVNLCDDIYYDMKSTAKREVFFKICMNLEMKKLKPLRRPDHRWLYILVVIERIKVLWDALKVFYFHYLSDNDKNDYANHVEEIYQKRKINQDEDKKDAIALLYSQLKSQQLTKDGISRKKRIVDGMFMHEKKTLIHLNLFLSVLVHFNKYIKLFEMKKPMIHLLHSSIYALIKEFLTMFLKPEILADCITYKKLLLLNVTDEKILPDTLLFTGCEAMNIMKTLTTKHPVVKDVTKSLRNAYVSTAQYMLKKLPLGNKTLINFSSLDPDLRGETSAISALNKLLSYLPHVFSPTEEQAFDMEIRIYQSDQNINEDMKFKNVNESKVLCSLDEYWTNVFKMKENGCIKYPLLSKLVKAYLSCFHGPTIESVFNFMDNIVTDYRTSLSADSLDAVLTIKYDLMSSNMSSCEKYGSANPMTEPLPQVLINNMLNSWSSYQEVLKKCVPSSTITVPQLSKEKPKLSQLQINKLSPSPVNLQENSISDVAPSDSGFNIKNKSSKRKENKCLNSTKKQKSVHDFFK